MAIAIDEYGAVDGLVTLEDVIEEIVGDIIDEDEKVQAEVIPLEKGGWLVEGRLSLDKLSEIVGIKFEVEESVTLAGFLAEKLQHLPRKGERYLYGGYCFQIQQANRQRVFQVLIFKDTLDGNSLVG
jgi:magnesium and cobalt transporter